MSKINNFSKTETKDNFGNLFFEVAPFLEKSKEVRVFPSQEHPRQSVFVSLYVASGHLF